MATCNINSSWSLGCNDSIGGIARVYISNYSAATTYTTSAAGVITGLTNSDSFYTHQLPKESSNFDENGQVSAEFQNSSVEQLITLRFNKNEAALRDRVLLLMQSRTRVIVEYNTGKSFLLGKEYGLDASTATGASGKLFADGNGWTIVLRATEKEPANEISLTATGLTIV
jgi:hypothetical protein